MLSVNLIVVFLCLLIALFFNALFGLSIEVYEHLYFENKSVRWQYAIFQHLDLF